MADLHVDDFYRDCALIFQRLYASFPRKVMLYAEDISGPDTPDEFGVASPRHQSSFGAMLWLAEQGYLTYESTIRQEGLDQVVLSRQGFVLLSTRCTLPPGEDSQPSEPESLAEHNASTINRLRAAVRSRSSLDIKRVISHLLAESLP